MSVEAMAIALHHSRAKGTAKLVLVGIANHAGDGGAWPSIATLAHYANVTPRNAAKAVQTLRALGEITVDIQGGGLPDMEDHQRPNRYTVLVSCPPWCDRTSNHRDTRGRQSALWKNPPSVPTPPVASVPSPPSYPTPVPPSIPTAKPSTQPSGNPVTALTTDRARPSRELCGVCGQTRFECARRSTIADTGHLFEPSQRRRA